MKQPIPDIITAKTSYRKSSASAYGPAYNEYSPAYATTNEDIRIEIAQTPPNKKILTTCASGDHPMLYAQQNKHVDTFDISYCAYAVMQLKIAALKTLTYRDYTNLLLHINAHDKNLMEISHMPHVVEQIPDITCQKFIKFMQPYRIFSMGAVVLHRTINENEYADLQSKIDSPFNFIWTDVCQLHTHLDTTYDCINLSNILDYIEFNTVMKIFGNLVPHVNIGGKIVGAYFGNGTVFQSERVQKILAEYNMVAKIDTNARILTFQRTK